MCPDCGFRSVKMDPFAYLSLPLPSAKMRSIEVTVVTMDGSAPPTQYALEVLKLGATRSVQQPLQNILPSKVGFQRAAVHLLPASFPSCLDGVVTPAGTIGDLYRALAKVCSIEAERPENLLLLVEIFSGRVHQKFVDMGEPLADGIRGNVTLLAYRYPSSEVGPASGGKELHVFQR